MARHQDALAAEALGDQLTDAWSKSGRPSFEKLARLLYDALGEGAPTKESIRKWHRGLVSPQGVHLASICIIARYYDVTVGSLSPILGERLAAEKEVLSQTPGWVTADSALAKSLVTAA